MDTFSEHANKSLIKVSLVKLLYFAPNKVPNSNCRHHDFRTRKKRGMIPGTTATTTEK